MLLLQLNTSHLSTYGYYWQTSPTGTITTGSNANREYMLTGDGNTTIYLRKKSNIDGTWSTIDQYTTYLYPVFIAGVITGINSPICSGESITLSGTKPQGGNGTYSYKWQSKPAGSSHLITYQDIPNSNVESLTIDVFSSAFFRRLDYSSDCDFEVTNEVYIYISHSVNPGSIGNRSDYTIGTLSNATWGYEPGDLLSYQWQESSDNSNWDDVIGQTDSWITPTYDKWYRRKVITPCGDEAVTSSVQAIRPITVISEDCDEAVLEAPPVTSHLSTYGYYWQTSPTGTITTGSNANREYTLTGDENTIIYLRKKSNIDGTWSSIDQYIFPYCVNHIKTITARSNVTTETALDALSGNSKNVFYQYFDGLGRERQHVQKAQSPSSFDFVVPFQYDELNRQPIQYLPFVSSNQDGSYNDNVLGTNYLLSDHYDYYKNRSDYKESFAFSETHFESSPLNRPLEKSSPGEDWQIGSGNTITYSYGMADDEEVILWRYDGLFDEKDTYDAGELYKNSVTDEDGNVTIEYTNKRGQTILKKSYEKNTNEWAETNYIYDDFDQLAVVLPPVATNQLDDAFFNKSEVERQDFLDRWAFQYNYDERGRMTMKKVPGSDPVMMVYDRWDRLVLTQDGVQRANDQWLFTKYDVLNRPVVTGVVNNYGSLIADVESSEERFEVLDGTIAETTYSNSTFPKHANVEQYLAVTFYDDYAFLDDPTSALYGRWFSAPPELSEASKLDAYHLDPLLLESVKGRVTGTKTKVLGSNDYVESVTFYDNKYRVIQVISKNHLRGIDVVSSQYDFIGNIRRVHSAHSDEGGNTITEQLLEYEYDHADRLLTCHYTLGEEDPVLLYSNEYTELGKLAVKRLHGKKDIPSDNSEEGEIALGEDVVLSEYDGSPEIVALNSVTLLSGFTAVSANGDLTVRVLQSDGDSSPDQYFEQNVNYDYSIRGWLTRINDANLSDANDLFGIDLYYNSNPINENNTHFNGNISAMKWSDHQGMGTGQEHAYDFSYDGLNRLTAANYRSNGSTTHRFDVTDIGYDLNGNILHLTRWGLNPGNLPGMMDELSYTYRGNQLLRVSDTRGSAGFKDGNTSGDDYGYDANGNMIFDANKGITRIEYNHLNLPSMIMLSESEASRIEYLYDAAGTKLRQTVYEGGIPTKTTDYVGDFIYEDVHDGKGRKLQLIQHEEGRIVPNESEGTYDYQYHLKDHLGNVRVTFSTTPENYEMVETFESGENNGFQDLHRHTNANANTTAGGDEVALLQAGETGAMIFLSMNKGDTVDLTVHANYETTPSNNNFLGTAYSALFSLFDATYGSGVEHGVSSSSSVFDEALNGIDMSVKGNSSTAPRAFLNYIFFDQKMNYVRAGFLQITTAAQGIGVYETISLNDIVADREGYILAYLSNENQAAMNVHFDDFTVYHGKTNVVSTQDYYPFGLTFDETVRMANTAQNFLFNGGSELNKITNIYETQFRSYDPAIGRFEQIDPYASSFFELNPYQYAFNNPILFNDPSGLYPKQEFGSGTRLAECPSCPDSEEYDQYRDDHENFYEYDPETGEVNHVGTLLKEVVVEGEDQSEKTITQKYGAPIIGSGADDAPFGRVQSKYKLPTIDYAKLMEILELITRPFAREKTKPKDWKDKMKDSKDAIEKVQKVEKEIEDMKRGQQEEKKALNAKDYPPYPTGVVLPYQSSDSIPGTDSLRAFNIYEKIGGRYRKVGTDTLRIK